MKYIVKLNNKEYEVVVENGKAGVMSVKETAGQSAGAEQKPVNNAQAVNKAQSAPAVSGEGEQIKAPMPGTILDVKVTPGSSVKKGQVLLILEAMKMENEILAPADGTVSQVQVAKGSSVNTGDVLVVIR